MSLSSLNGKVLIYDVETTGLNPWRSLIYSKYSMEPARPFAFAFMDELGNKAYIRWEVDPKTRKVIPVKSDQRKMSDILRDPSLVKIGHNLGFDIRQTRMSGMEFDWTRIHDTLPLSHVYTGGSLQVLTHYALKPLCKHLLGIPEDDQTKLLESVKKARTLAKKKGWALSNKETHGKDFIKSDYWLGDPDLCRTYALKDVYRAGCLFFAIIDEIKKVPQRYNTYLREIAFLKEIYRSETRGVRVLPETLDSLEIFYEDYMKKWKKVADREGGKDLNFNSPKQMVNIFCHQKGYKTTERTATGQPSIDAAELKRLSEKDPLAKAILEYKAGDDMLTKFINPYRRFMEKRSDSEWVLHPSFRQCGTATGRTSCADPNLQQAAAEDSAKKKADIGLKPREAIGPRKGHLWLMPDYSQMEVWIFAFDAGDPILTKALLNGEDIHTATSTQAWGDEPDFKERAKYYRKMGKTLQFLKQYGGTAKAASRLLECSKAEAQDVIDRYDERLPGVAAFVERMTLKAESEGSIENVFGRWSPFEPEWAYKAVNYSVQGTCADIMKRAYIRLAKYLRQNKLGHVLANIHDEIIIELPVKNCTPQLLKEIIKLMQKDSKRVGIPVPLPVGMKKTLTVWSKAEEIKIC